MDSKLVSVIIPTYKRSNDLPRAIDSVLGQTYPNIEIIVVDDNGEGTQYQVATEQRLRKYIETGKISYIKHPVNRNGSAARNTGFNYSHGEYINFLDDDDIFLADKIKRQVEVLENTEGMVGGTYTPVCFLYKNIDGSTFEIPNLYDKNGDLCEAFLIGEARFNTSGILFKRKVLEDLNGFDESFRRHQDFELMIRFFEKYTLKCASSFPLYYMDMSSDGSHGVRPEVRFEFEKSFLNKFSVQLKKERCYHSVSHALYYQCCRDLILEGYFRYAYKSMFYSFRHGLFTMSELFVIIKYTLRTCIKGSWR